MTDRKVNAALSAVFACMASAALCTPSWAQQEAAPASASPDQAAATPAAAGDQLQEVVVTAERRQTNLQQTPIVITAISGISCSRTTSRTSAICRRCPRHSRSTLRMVARIC